MEKTLPKGWKKVKLGDIASQEKFSIRMGPFGSQLKKHELVNGGIKVLWIENIVNNEFEWKDNKCITSEKYELLKGFQVKPNDILTTTMGTIGKTCVVPNNIGQAIISSHLLKISLDLNIANPEFIAVCLRHPYSVHYFNSSSHGIVMKGLNTTIIKNVPIYLPPLPVQHKIVEILEEADNLRKLRQKADEKMKDLIPSLFVEMFGDPTTNPKGWEMVTIDRVKASKKFSIVDGPFGSAMKVSDYIESGIPVIQVNNITAEGFNANSFRYISEDKYQSVKRSTVKNGDILVAKVGHTIGKSCIMPNIFEKAVITANCAKISVDESIASNIYINSFINMPFFQCQIRNQLGNTAKPMMNLTTIKNFKILLPPLPLQQEFAVRVEEIETEKERQTESKKKLDELFNRLMQRAFTGELVA